MGNKGKILLCLIVWVGLFLLSLQGGASAYGILDYGRLFKGEDEVLMTILMDIRLPRVLVVLLTGAALSAAGGMCQGVFRNPLASPTIIGTSSGSAAAAALMFYSGLATAHWLVLPMAAFVGGGVTTLFLLALVRVRKLYDVQSLLLVGVALNAFFGALTTLIVSLSLEDLEQMRGVMGWLMGGFNAVGWDHVVMGVFPIALGLVLAWPLCLRLDVLALGEGVAQTLGVDNSRLKVLCVLVVALLVGTAVGMAGAIGFVGLVIPHLTRMIVGARHRILLPVSMVNGMSLLLGADLIARTVRAPLELQVGVLVALAGAPFFFWLLMNHTKEAHR